MSVEPEWVELEIIESIHYRQLSEHGGMDGIRDRGMLESALSRPQQAWIYGISDLCALAAAYAFGIAKNHPFLDGNKRVAFFATDVFLRLNGWKFEVNAHETYTLLSGLLETGQCDFEHLLGWIRGAVTRLD